MGLEVNPATIRTHGGSTIFRIRIVGDAYDGGLAAWRAIGRSQKEVGFGTVAATPRAIQPSAAGLSPPGRLAIIKI